MFDVVTLAFYVPFTATRPGRGASARVEKEQSNPKQVNLTAVTNMLGPGFKNPWGSATS